MVNYFPNGFSANTYMSKLYEANHDGADLTAYMHPELEIWRREKMKGVKSKNKSLECVCTSCTCGNKDEKF